MKYDEKDEEHGCYGMFRKNIRIALGKKVQSCS